jgi:hypothetical protein
MEGVVEVAWWRRRSSKSKRVEVVEEIIRRDI